MLPPTVQKYPALQFRYDKEGGEPLKNVAAMLIGGQQCWEAPMLTLCSAESWRQMGGA